MDNIQHLDCFVHVVQKEYWSKYPERYAEWCHFLGMKINLVQSGNLDEAVYILEWQNKELELPEEQ